ncbi:unnamed protein product [Moneuplotes crassus]|uniref:Uncharacterized protein n=1 Tax=Euplotes crassus TaxID=5936 RepID=A0AAD1UDH6_EUPCR|nr:unnamed protein product [Moneuplotes crassus]
MNSIRKSTKKSHHKSSRSSVKLKLKEYGHDSFEESLDVNSMKKQILPEINRSKHNNSYVDQNSKASIINPLINRTLEEKEEYMKQRMKVVENKRKKQIKVNFDLNQKLISMQEEKEKLLMKLKKSTGKDVSPPKQTTSIDETKYKEEMKKLQNTITEFKKKLKFQKNIETKLKQEKDQITKYKDLQIQKLQQKHLQTITSKDKLIHKLKSQLAQLKSSPKAPVKQLTSKEDSQSVSSYQNSYFRESVPGELAEGVCPDCAMTPNTEEVIATLNQQLQEYKDRVIEESKETERLRRIVDKCRAEIDHLNMIDQSIKLEVEALKAQKEEILVENLTIKKLAKKVLGDKEDSEQFDFTKEQEKVNELVMATKKKNETLSKENEILTKRLKDLEQTKSATSSKIDELIRENDINIEKVSRLELELHHRK